MYMYVLQASIAGNTREFQELFERNQRWLSESQLKREQWRQQREQQDLLEQQRRRAALLRHLSRPPVTGPGQPLWVEREEEERHRRQERLERRRRELLALSRTPQWTERAPTSESLSHSVST